ncbi:MAG: rhomboid family intramembrane serine protease [Desulfatirhabdiaceae bacterium]
MIPLRDTLSSRSYPVVTTLIIAVNVGVYLIQMTQGSQLDRFIYIYGMVPARYTIPQISAYFSLGQQAFSLISFMFLHGGFWHLLGNMWSLYIFGDNVEDRVGPIRYLIFYLLCGLVSGLTHLFFNHLSNVPTIGASGAIAGVMGAYFLMFPRARILTLIPVIIIPFFVEIPAFFFLGMWLLFQFLNAAGSQGAGGIAWWAHIGGFVFGMAIIRMLTTDAPSGGVSRQIKKFTEKHSTPRLQVIRPSGAGDDPNLYATITITPHEAVSGAAKLVNLPWGFYNRIIRVKVPPHAREGMILRLQGMGMQTPGGLKGDLMLKVMIQ